MPAERPTGPGSSPIRGGSLRAVSRATGAATVLMDPEVMYGNIVDAAVRHLGALRADVWRFQGRRPIHMASAGIGGDTPSGLPPEVVRVARGGISQSVPAAAFGPGEDGSWRRLLFSIGSDELGVFTLTIGEETIGALTIAPERGEQSATADHEALTIFAHQVASALEKAELHQAVQDAAVSMRLQNRVLSELTDERDVPSLRAATETLVAEFIPGAAIALLPIDSIGRLTVPQMTPPTDGTLRVATEPEMELIAPAMDAHGVVLLRRPDLRMCAALGLSSLAGIEHPEQSRLWGVTLRTGEHATGILLIGADGSAGTHGLDERVQELALSLAPALSIALGNARLFAREHVRASRLSAANTLARTVTSCATREDLRDALAVGVRALFGFHRVAVYDTELASLNEEGERSARGAGRERSLVSTALHRRRGSRIERHDRTCHAIPLMGSEKIHAVLYAEQSAAITPEQEGDDLALLASICEHTAACLVAIDATEQIERNYKDTIQALVHALEARDQYTADHSDVVAEWALSTGKRLGMAEADLRDLELGAILHDIGKVAVPDQILNKTGRLTEEEFEVMKSHTIIGERILKPIGFLTNVAPIVRHEHERWDGLGYPDGISGTAIPIASRIIFVCDAYHAMTSDRPYRTGQTHGFARRILTENAGTQFDPAVVSVFLDVIDAWCGERGVETDGSVMGEEIVNPMGRVREVVTSDEDAAAA
ncbi:MAG: HD-GYP domain-containing protein [Thermoleophilia bacterium]|nr:HD-GYP domain-containing protein [Thermoleophilia bacterium]